MPFSADLPFLPLPFPSLGIPANVLSSSSVGYKYLVNLLIIEYNDPEKISEIHKLEPYKTGICAYMYIHTLSSKESIVPMNNVVLIFEAYLPSPW
jgi:hypothetical protein